MSPLYACESFGLCAMVIDPFPAQGIHLSVRRADCVLVRGFAFRTRGAALRSLRLATQHCKSSFQG